MRTQTCGEYEIEDLLGHPAEMVEELRELLSESATIIPDARRAEFYEVHGADFTYYFHIIPGSGKVLLLAAWATA
ncbi:MAG: hypothetical protein ACRD4X_07700 [Candidatus Acidiferrales bacterium]